VATVYHRYVRRGEQPEPAPARDADADAAKAKKLAADLEFVHENRLQVIARRRECEIRNAQRKRELISRAHVIRQETFLVISLRQRLLALPAQHARSLVNISDDREMQQKLDAIIREALDEVSSLPQRVSDERWLEKLDEREAALAKRPRRAAE
jgi:hypothetical protein